MKKGLLSVMMALIAIIIPTNSWAQNIIQFEDNEVKAICVANWDTNGDGELSMEEAAAVTDIGKVFMRNYNITRFNELEYFTGLTAITDSAFAYCFYLEEVALPPNVKSIGDAAFVDSDSLTYVEIHEGLESIGSSAFAWCSKLASVIIPSTVTSIGTYAYIGSTNMEYLHVDENNPVYDSRNDCNAIIETATNILIAGCRSTVVPEGVVTIGKSAFINCAFENGLTLPTSLRTIDEDAFRTCSGISQLVLPEGLETINSYGFQYCDVEKLTLPSTLISIGSDSFEGTNLRSIRIPASITHIGMGAFSSNNDLEEIVVEEGNSRYSSPNNCNAIYEASTGTIVQGCYTTVFPEGVKRLGWSSFLGMKRITTMIIPEGVVDLGDYTFYYCDGIRELSIPSTVGSNGFGEVTFEDCTGLETIRCYIKKPSALPSKYSGPFGCNRNRYQIYEQATLYVPYGTKALYESTDGWNRFKNIVEMEKNDVDVVTVSLINNGDMEGDDVSNYFVKIHAGDIVPATITEGVGVNESRGIKVEATAMEAEAWDNQFWVRLSQPVSEGTKFRISYDYRADKEGLVQTEAHEEPSTFIAMTYYGDSYDDRRYFSPEWQRFSYEGTMSSMNSSDQHPMQSVAFSLNHFEDANNYYFDNIVFEVILEDQCPKPTFKQTDNTVTIQSPFDATIYYTLDGSEPTTNSEHATGAIALSLSENTTIKAIAVVEGYETSPVATYQFEPTENNLDQKREELLARIEELEMVTAMCGSVLQSKDSQGDSNLWKELETIKAAIEDVHYRTVNATTEEELDECEDRIYDIAARLEWLQKEIDNYNPINFSFDGLTAWVSGGATLDEALADAGGRGEAAKTIAAIVWENTTALTADMLQGFDNPNLLVYVNEASLAPQGVQNVVINGQAKEIILTDAATGNNNWYCPEAFTAEKISYTRHFSQRTEIGVSRGWEGITLPFNVETITHETKGSLAPFGTGTGVKHFWLRTLSQNGMTSARSIEAYKPYVISMPNNTTAYPSEYNLNGRVTFSASNVTVPATPDTDNLVVTRGDITMAPAYQSYNYEDIYAINVGQARGNHAEGSVFERGLREVRPFEVFTVHEGQGARPRYIPIEGQTNSEATGISNLTPTLSEGEGGWYDLSGRKLSGEPKRKGVYIQNGKKIRLK